MSGIGVGFDALASGESQLDRVAESVSDRVSAARSRVAALLDGGWSGGAASAFGREFETWASAADDAVGTLRQLVDGVRATAAEFARAEESATATSRALASSLPSLGVAAMMGGE